MGFVVPRIDFIPLKGITLIYVDKIIALDSDYPVVLVPTWSCFLHLASNFAELPP